ncbi:hypothetical protein E6Q11_03175 [Candidatus Dojkabacteria bacterium]|uniref:Uncharacterized protein n=1 Tax=Candidatus Dojkabacteria bacterium TaxID=2099670 RepID=A0A5C7J7Q8_9BACT|nr:MAG: hypothetical protein E6Q11_03175 [Candidatus Dojkabacteria bacterium]
MEPLDVYSQIQPLVKNEINNALNDFADERQFDVAKIPAHTHTGVDSNKVSYGNLVNRTRYILYRIIIPTTDTAVANGVGGDFVMPFSGYITSVGATVDTAGTTNTTTIDLNKNGTSVLLTKITIDSTEKTSRTATTQPVLNSASVTFQTGDIFTWDIDAVSTTPAKGCTPFINVIQTD